MTLTHATILCFLFIFPVICLSSTAYTLRVSNDFCMLDASSSF